MAKWRPMTPEEFAAHQARTKRLKESTDAAILAGVEAAGRGEDIATAMRGSQEEHADVALPGRARLPAPGGGIDLEGSPRVRDEGWTADRQRAFLAHLAQTGCISHACTAVGLSRQSAYALRHRYPNSVFAIGWEVAIGMARQAMLDEATERAFLGREVEVWYHGEHRGTRIVHNDRLLMFLLGLKREPAHPALDTRELTHLFPAMLRMVDVVLPPAFSAERIAELTGGGGEEDS